MKKYRKLKQYSLDPFNEKKIKTISRDKEGRPHSLNKAAVIFKDGTEMWYRHGTLHREGGPARIFGSGQKEYWLRGKLYGMREAHTRMYGLNKNLFNPLSSSKDI